MNTQAKKIRGLRILKLFGTLLMILGIAITAILPRYIQQQYKEQANWIPVEGTLKTIKVSYDDDGDTYKGVYVAHFEGRDIEFNGESVSKKSKVTSTYMVYINPDNYDDYHKEIKEHDWIAGVGGGLATFVLGFMMWIASKHDIKRIKLGLTQPQYDEYDDFDM